MQVAEHAAWLSTNCNNQLTYYNLYLGQRNMPIGSSAQQQQQQLRQQKTASGSSSSSNGNGAPPETASSSSSSGVGGAITTADVAAAVAAASGSKSLAAVADFKPEAARTLLEEEIREAFLGTAGSAAGGFGERVLGKAFACWAG